MDRTLSASLRDLAQHQHGVLTRRQLDGGITPAQLRTRLGCEWRLVLRGVVLLSNAVPNEQQRLMAAQLFAGPRSWLAGPTAAALHGIGDLTVTNPIHVLVPAPLRSRTHAWVVVRNTTLLLNAGLSLAASGAWSLPEAELLRLLSSSTVLPPLLANPELRDGEGHRLTTPDVWVDDVAMAIMVHSRKWHAGEREWESTVEHDTDLQAARVLVVGVTPHSIRARPRWVLERVETAYLRARSAGGRADVVATPRDPWQNGRLLLPGPARAWTGS